MKNKLINSNNMNQLIRIYQALLEQYGHQGWWPVTPNCCNSPPLYGRTIHNERQKTEIMIGAILTQNTQWDPNVTQAIMNLNQAGMIDPKKLLKVPDSELAQIIRSSGYCNQKARALKSLSLFLLSTPHKKLSRMETEDARKLLLEVHGIGPETADSILIYALEKPIFVIDSYTRRIMSHLGYCMPDSSYDDIQAIFMESLPHDHSLFNDYHAQLVRHGKEHYRKKPYEDPVLERFTATISS